MNGTEEQLFTPLAPKEKKPEEEEVEQFTPLLKKGEISELEPKPSFFQKIKDLAPKILPFLKESALMVPDIQRPIYEAQARKLEKEKPKPPVMPVMRAMTPKEKQIAEETLPSPQRYPKAEELEYGRFEKILDVPGQALTNFVKSFLWGLPELIPGEEPTPKSEAAEALGALGSLAGLAGAGAGELASYAPFKVTGKIATQIWKKPAKTLAGKVVQNVIKNANTLGLALGAVEWEGGDASEILKNKAQSFISGEAIGGFFGGMQFVHFSKLHPMLSFIIRYGTGSALLDFAQKKQPFDDRSLFNKIFDYGLNAYFLQHGVSPKTYQRVSTDLLKEIKRFNKQTKAEGIVVKLPESLDEIRQRIGVPIKMAAERIGPEPRLMPAPTRIATEKGVIIPPEMPEAEKLKIGYRGAEGLKPEEITPTGEKVTINVNPTPEGGVRIEIPTTGVKRGAEFEEPIRMAKAKPSPLRKEVLDAIKDDVGKIKPNRDYSRKALINMGLPIKLIAPKDSTYPTMDEAASMLSKKFNFIDYDSDLEHVLRSTRMPEKPKITEKEYYRRKAEEYKKEEESEVFGIKPWDEQKAILKQRLDRGEHIADVYEDIPKEMPVGKFPEQLRKYHEKLYEEKAIPKEAPSAAEEARKARLEEARRVKEPKEEIFRITPELKELEEALLKGKLKGKELTEEQKRLLKEREAYEYKEAPKEEPLEEVEEIEKLPERMKLVKVSIETPTGKVEDLGELPLERIKNIQKHAKELGVEGKLRVGKAYKGRWGEYLPPTEVEKFMRDMIRDVKKKPKEEWESWEKEVDDEYQKLYSGLPPTDFVKHVGSKILAKLQIEPQFKAIGAPDTGLALKRYHPIRNGELEKGIRAAKSLSKRYKNLTDEDYQKLTFIASKPGKFYPMTPEERHKFSHSGEKETPYRDVRKFFDEYENRLKELDVIEEGWPKSQLNRLREEKAHIKAILNKKIAKTRRAKLENQLKDIYDSIEFIKKSHPQYVHIPRMWFELIWDRNPRAAPRIITQLFRQRETLDIEKLAKYLTETKARDLIPKDEWEFYKNKDLDKPLLKPKDLDIRRLMVAYAHKVGHKIALAEIFKNAEKEGLLKDADKAPRDWQTMPSWMYPTLKGKRAHPVFKDFFEKNFVRRGFMPPKLGGILGTIKLMQFYNPLFLPMYDVVQAWWAGSVRSVKTPSSIWKAAKSMKNADKDYWDMHYWGGFSTPYTPSFDMYMKRADTVIKKNNFLKNLVKLKYINPYELYKLSWHTAWTGDHFIRMITYHHYLSKGFTPREAAQTTARLHADYASIPPATRKWLNKIFFTPSFKIAMMSAQAEMIKNAGKYLFKAKKMGNQEKAMAKALVGLASGILLREWIMHQLGYKTDQFGLKYTKEVETDEGKKELVLHTASPDNVFLRFYHRFKPVLPFVGKEERKFEGFVNRAKWELHPLWQLTQELMANKSVSFEPIYNEFDLDHPEKVTRDVLDYSARRLIRFTEILPGKEKSIKRKQAYKALIKDLDKFGAVLSFFVLPYTRNTEQKRLVYEINRLKRRFKIMKEDDPPKTAQEAEQRLMRFRRMLEDLRKRLREARGEE